MKGIILSHSVVTWEFPALQPHTGPESCEDWEAEPEGEKAGRARWTWLCEGVGFTLQSCSSDSQVLVTEMLYTT